jgi:hypothetical protein
MHSYLSSSAVCRSLEVARLRIPDPAPSIIPASFLYLAHELARNVITVT